MAPTIEVQHPLWTAPHIDNPDWSIVGWLAAKPAKRPPRTIPDPDAKPRMITVPDPSAVRPTVTIADPDAEHPTVEIANPDCRMPDDVVEITAERHLELMEEQAAGKIIVAGDDGQPIAVDRPAPTHEQLWHTLQRAAQGALDASSEVLMRCYEAGLPAPAEWVAYRKALRAIVASVTGDPSSALPKPPAEPDGI